jgi:hypothetical protein
VSARLSLSLSLQRRLPVYMYDQAFPTLVTGDTGLGQDDAANDDEEKSANPPAKVRFRVEP